MRESNKLNYERGGLINGSIVEISAMDVYAALN
jgi:hypothetical protein